MKSISITYRIFALSMAVLMFFTSVGITLDMHYCQGQLKTFNFFGKAKSCHEIGEGLKSCPHHKKMTGSEKSSATTVSKKGCCSNKTFYIQSNQDQQLQSNTALVKSFNLKQFAIAFTQVFLTSTVTELDKPALVLRKPPFIPRDIYVLLETFRL